MMQLALLAFKIDQPLLIKKSSPTLHLEKQEEEKHATNVALSKI